MKRFVTFVAVLLLPLLAAGCSPTSPGKIAFASDLEDPGHYFAVYTIDPDGSNLIKIGEAGLASFKWSPDGTRIAFFGPDGELWVGDADGTNTSRVELPTGERLQPWVGGTLSWSPDGTEILVSGIFYQSERDYTPDLCTINVETGELKKLTDTPDDFEYGASWSPKGSQIAFATLASPFPIYVMDADGSNQRLLATIPQLGEPISWSPDGKHIMYVSRIGKKGYGEIYLVDVEDGTSINLTNSPDIHDCDPAWSRDGKKIAFCSGKYGEEQVHVMDADGSHLIKLTDEELGCHHEPLLAPDGKRILFSGHNPSWSPDGKRIVFSGSTFCRPGGSEWTGWSSIFVVDIDSRSVTDLIASGPGDYQLPVWSPR